MGSTDSDGLEMSGLDPKLTLFVIHREHNQKMDHGFPDDDSGRCTGRKMRVTKGRATNRCDI